MTDHLLSDIRRQFPALELRPGEPMREHCSFRIGGPCSAMAFPRSEEELRALLVFLLARGERPLIIGNGTNLLVSDRGISRFVIKLGDGFAGVRRDGTEITAASGITLARLAVFARNEGLSGLEFAHGIPGTLGGAVYMNAGAYGGEIKDVCRSVRYLDAAGAAATLCGGELDFSYRHSFFSGADCVILSARLALSPGSPEEIGARMRELAEKRRASQPLDRPSAGSTFKRPPGGFAAALIDQCGLKGYSCGPAQVSPKHAGFVVNNGGASFDDVLMVMEHVRETVLRETGVLLEPEVKIITG